MEETMIQAPSLTQIKANMEAYFSTHDIKYVHENATFIHMHNGEEIQGKEAIGNFLHFIYHIAFDARAISTGQIITQDKAMIEGVFVGRHIGEFAGIPATGKEVRVPLCVSYDLEDGLIMRARVYLLTDVMMNQLTGK